MQHDKATIKTKAIVSIHSKKTSFKRNIRVLYIVAKRGYFVVKYLEIKELQKNQITANGKDAATKSKSR